MFGMGHPEEPETGSAIAAVGISAPVTSDPQPKAAGAEGVNSGELKWLLRGSAQTLTIQAAQVGLYLAFAVLCGRFLGSEGKGMVDMCLLTGALASLVFGLSMPSGITYSVSKGNVDIVALRRVLVMICLAQVVVSVGAVRIIVAAQPKWKLLPDGLGIWPICMVAAFIGSDLLRSNLRAILVGQLKIVQANTNDLLKQVGLLAAIACIYAVQRVSPLNLEWKVKLVLIGLNLSAIPALVSAYLSIRKEGVGGSVRLSEIFRIALPSGVANIVQGINYRAPAIVVASVFGTAAVGVYQVAFSIAQMLALVPGAVALLLFPSVARQGAGSLGAAERTNVVCILTVAAQSVFALGAYLMARTAVPWLLGPAFSGAVDALAFLLPGAVVFAATTVLAGHVAGRGRPVYSLLSAVAGCITVWVAAKYLPAAYGIRGAAIASSLSAIAGTVAMIGFYARMERIELPVLIVSLKKVGGQILRASKREIRAW